MDTTATTIERWRSLWRSSSTNSAGTCGTWMPRCRATLDRFSASYRPTGVFREYRLIGDGSRLQRTRAGFVALKALARLTRPPLPGWYDTHASRAVD
jgi:hypothetical protein